MSRHRRNERSDAHPTPKPDRNRWLVWLVGLALLATLLLVAERLTRPQGGEGGAEPSGVEETSPGIVAPPAVHPGVQELVAEGKSLADELASIAPDHAMLLAQAGSLWFLLGDSGKARECWHNALDLDANSAEALLGMAEYYHEQGQFDEAVQVMRQLALAHPAFAREKTFVLADSLLSLGDAQTLIEALNEAATTGPLPPWAIIMLGQAYYQQGEYDKSAEQYEAVLAQNPESSTAHYGLAQVLVRLDRVKEARAHRVEFARLKEKDLDAFDRMRGYGNQTKEKHSAGKLQPIIAKFHFEAGQAYAQCGRMDDAERHLRRAWALAPDQPQPRQLLEYLYRG